MVRTNPSVALAEVKKDISYLGENINDLTRRFDKFEDIIDSVREEQAAQRERQKNWNYGLGILQTIFGLILAYLGVRTK